MSSLKPLERQVQVIHPDRVQSHLPILIRVPQHHQLRDHRHSTRQFRCNLHRQRHRHRHVEALLLVSHARHLALQLPKRRRQISHALLRLSQLLSLAFDDFIRPFRRSLLQLLHRRLQVGHLLFAQRQRRERVEHGARRLRQHLLTRRRLRSQRLLRRFDRSIKLVLRHHSIHDLDVHGQRVTPSHRRRPIVSRDLRHDRRNSFSRVAFLRRRRVRSRARRFSSRRSRVADVRRRRRAPCVVECGTIQFDEVLSRWLEQSSRPHTRARDVRERERGENARKR